MKLRKPIDILNDPYFYIIFGSFFLWAGILGSLDIMGLIETFRFDIFIMKVIVVPLSSLFGIFLISKGLKMRQSQ